MFPAYGAQTIHMPFGDVYTSLQTGVVEAAENGINVYQMNKHYEVAPIMSLTQHEANNNVVWVSDKVWNSLNDEQKGWVQAAADEVGRTMPAKALDLEHESMARLEKIGVKFVKDVDKSGFVKEAEPLQDQLTRQLGPGAVKVLQLVRNVQLAEPAESGREHASPNISERSGRGPRRPIALSPCSRRATGKAAGNRLPRQHRSRPVCTLCCCIPAGVERNGLCRRAKRHDRIPLGGGSLRPVTGTGRRLRRPRSRRYHD